MSRHPVRSDPIWVGQIDVAAEDPNLEAVLHPLSGGYQAARVLVRHHGVPVAFLSADYPVSETQLTRAIIDRTKALWGVSADGDVPNQCDPIPISVVICTRDRPVELRRCLSTLVRLDYSDFEVVVIDNAPSDARTREVVATVQKNDERFRYVVEPVPGLSSARNRGLSEARHRIVAFTDDDTIVDHRWLQGIRRGFERQKGVACVTGLLASAELETHSQQYFDQHSGWPTSMHGRVFGRSDMIVPSYPFSAGIFGAGANFAVDRDVVRALGGFDTCLGAGTPVGGGEDLDMFLRIIFADREIAYEPSALIWHVHRVNDAELKEQLHAWSRGLAGYITKTCLEQATRSTLLRRTPRIAVRVLQVWRTPPDGGTRTPTSFALKRTQVSGFSLGVLLYLKARKQQRSGSAASR